MQFGFVASSKETSARIVLTNQPRIVALQAEASLLLDEEHDVLDRLKLAPAAG
jgi:hypothetical protein